MTGLHALHMIIGAGLLIWLIRNSFRGRFTPQYNTPVEIVGCTGTLSICVDLFVPVVISD